jgi:hypothetical protein
MERLVFFRLFLAFPLIGVAIPDLGYILPGFRFSLIPVPHLIIESAIIICMIVCSFVIRYFKRKQVRVIAEDKSLISA